MPQFPPWNPTQTFVVYRGPCPAPPTHTPLGQAYEPIQQARAQHPLRPPTPPPPTWESEIQIGLQKYNPLPTKHGVSGSFFLANSSGHKCAIFKPMSMEAGGVKNHRLARGENVQFRATILPGQGAGNEVLAYELDRRAFGHRYGLPKTTLMRLRHPVFEGEEIGSAQMFLSGTKSLAEMTSYEKSLIPYKEWEKLNFRLISGSTDAHYGNILYCPHKMTLHLIDSGDDFVGEAGECQYYNPWVTEPQANLEMSPEEYYFLKNINIDHVMQAFEQVALSNENIHPILRVSTDKYLTQILRLLLAQTVGSYKLTQAEWNSILNHLEPIYTRFIHPHHASNPSISWQQVSARIDWINIRLALEMSASTLRYHRTQRRVAR